MSDNDHIRREVRAAYGAVARQESSGCCQPHPAAIAGERLGYTAEDLAAAPEGAHLGLGCGNPRAIAALQPGERVLDLGSGAGFDCFLAAGQVGATGQVIGVDMTPDMVSKARANARKAGHANVEFRLGEIEALPVPDDSVDVILSNCVINLSPDKPQVFREAFRVLRAGGRLAISDVVATAALPDEMRRDIHLYSCCVGGASTVDEIEAALLAAGFNQIRITPKDESRAFIRDWAPGCNVEDYVVSAAIEAVKPDARGLVTDTLNTPPLHASIVALVALAANIAANHPKQGLWQVERLRDLGVPEPHIRAAVEIARHIREEAGRQWDAQFDDRAGVLIQMPAPTQSASDAKSPAASAVEPLPIPVAQGQPGCTPTKDGQSCC